MMLYLYIDILKILIILYILLYLLYVYNTKSLYKANVFVREYPIRTDAVFTPNKFQAYRHKPLGQFSYM